MHVHTVNVKNTNLFTTVICCIKRLVHDTNINAHTQSLANTYTHADTNIHKNMHLHTLTTVTCCIERLVCA